jgi:aldehyde:ferredoxin oxidoreductase
VGVPSWFLVELHNRLGWMRHPLLKVGTRAFNLKRFIITAWGLPVKMMCCLAPDQFCTRRRSFQDKIPPQGQLLNDYYRLRKWSEFGEPSPELLQELDIEI